MSNVLDVILSNDSFFGKSMTKIGILVVSNILFCIACLPVVTIGASYTALYYVMFRMEKEDGNINPIKEFFYGFKQNIRQATISWCVIVFLFVFGYLDLYWCRQLGGLFSFFTYPLLILGVGLMIISLYLFPVMAVFDNTMSKLLKNSFYFACHKPWYLFFLLVVVMVPQWYTFVNVTWLPLSGFLWVTCGYAISNMICAKIFGRVFWGSREKHSK